MLGRLSSAEQFMSAELGRGCHELGKNFLRAYGCLALHFSQGNARPKLHMLQHVILALEPLSSSAFVQNPWAETVWGDEDYVGRISRSSRRTHPLTTAAATIARYQLLALRAPSPPACPDRVIRAQRSFLDQLGLTMLILSKLI